MDAELNINYYEPFILTRETLNKMPQQDQATLLEFEKSFKNHQDGMRHLERKIEQRRAELVPIRDLPAYVTDIYLEHIQKMKDKLYTMQHVYLKLMIHMSEFMIPSKKDELKELEEQDLTDRNLLKKEGLEHELHGMQQIAHEFKRVMVIHALKHSITAAVSAAAVTQFQPLLTPSEAVTQS